MKGDFTRDTFDPRNHFTRVLTQQGRVQLDADNNEQVAILWHYLRTLAADLIGPRGGPNANVGFEITLDRDNDTVTDLKIGPGRYYVDGILCENDGVGEGGEEVEVTYYDQPGYPLTGLVTSFPIIFLFSSISTFGKTTSRRSKTLISRKMRWAAPTRRHGPRWCGK